MLAYRNHNAGAVIHTHSSAAVLVTLKCPGKVFKCTHLEMIKVFIDRISIHLTKFYDHLHISYC